jgi:uncharacterized protein
MKSLDLLARVLLIVGGLNWGLVGAAQFDLVAALFGDMTLLTRATYVTVGFAALFQVLAWRTIQNRWAPAATRA